ncbi:VWA domain-containing protein [Streptomyces monticola]|uniref:VWA domain-containing protein n=1 Tax=Streptomyces monticola TaxID=2666263 RepID=A0ABW2JAX6_9ACTN
MSRTQRRTAARTPLRGSWACAVTGAVCALLALPGPPVAAASGPYGVIAPRQHSATAAPAHTAPGAALAAPAADDGPDPIDFAVVVDQSKSLADKDLAREVEAASLLTQGEISERSRAAVIGFGSSEKSGQTPVREVCGLTTSDASGRQKLSDCAQELSDRDPRRMGPGTDHPAALRQAVDRLAEDGRADTPKVVFLLTDGKLDVRDSPEYGADPSSRQANAAKQLDEELRRARREKIQVWPLGFGSHIDRKALARMASAGHRNGCADLPGAAPRMRVVKSAAEIDKALQETFAAARCARVAQGTVGKPPADLRVSIPPIATDGAITVTKHDRKVAVTYYDPRGRKAPTRGSADGSSFELSGQDGPVEALRVKNPLPGRWRVHLEAPEGHRDREVAVRAIWQGRLRSAVTLDPASPRPGERAVVEVRMQTRRGVVITDRSEVEGLKASARMSGNGFAPLVVPLSDDGRKPDAEAGDVRYTGEFTLPSDASGTLALTTQLAAPGVTSDRRPLYARVASGTPQLTAGISVDRATARPGDTVRGSLDLTNNDSAPHTLRLGLADQPPGSALRISPATVEAQPGRSRSVEFRVEVGKDTPLGELGGRITVVDTDDDGAVLDTAFVGIRVEAAPTWWDRFWGAILGAGLLVLLLAAFALVRLKARRERKDLRGVRIELRGDGLRPDELTVRSGQSTKGEFHFTVDRSRGGAPALRRAGPGTGGAHRLRRTAAGEFMFRPDRGRERRLPSGEVFALGEGLELLVHDRKSATGARRRPGSAGGRSGRERGDQDGTGRRPGAWRSTPRRRPGPASPPGGEQPAGSSRRFDPNF